MGTCEFNPFNTHSVVVSFKCNKCNNPVSSEEISLPEPNLCVDRAKDSYVKNEGYAYCGVCEELFDIRVNVGSNDGYVEVEYIEDELIEIEELYYDERNYNHFLDAILKTESNRHFNSEISNLQALNDLKLVDNKLSTVLKRQVFSGIITCVEDYLSTVFIKEVFSNESNLIRFVSNYKVFKQMKFSLNEIYSKMDQIKTIVKKELFNIVYHNLEKVRNMYEKTLEIEFPKIEHLNKYILVRHDIVHRNGKDKDGNEIEISSDMINYLIIDVENFIEEIDKQLPQEEPF